MQASYRVTFIYSN